MDFESLNKIVQSVLGKSLSDEDKGRVTHLNLFPEEILCNAKKIERPAGLDAVELYLKFYVPEKDWRYIRAFVHQVILGNRDVKTWRKGRVLFPDVSLKDQLTKTKEELFGEYIHKLQFITKPDFSNWRQGVSNVGDFVFPEPEADYTSITPKGFLPSGMDDATLLEIDKTQVDVLFRRWIAVRITSFLRAKGLLESFEYADALEAIAPRSTWTKDAVKALEGLLKEKELGIWKGEAIPGYSGPDDLYE